MCMGELVNLKTHLCPRKSLMAWIVSKKQKFRGQFLDILVNVSEISGIESYGTLSFLTFHFHF
jgi:hypothetical protein